MKLHHATLKTRAGILLPLALCLFLLMQGQAPAATKVPHFNLPAPDKNASVDINKFKGKVVLINFFATWCPPCRKEISSLIRLQKDYGNKGFSVIGLSVDDSGGRNRLVTKLMKKYGINYPVAMANNKTTKDFGDVSGIPQSFLVDRNGNIVKSYPGYIPHEIFERDIRNLLLNE